MVNEKCCSPPGTAGALQSEDRAGNCRKGQIRSLSSGVMNLQTAARPQTDDTMSHIVFAYLDPGTGSMLLQAIVGGSAGLLVFIRHLWVSFRSAKPNSETSSAGT